MSFTGIEFIVFLPVVFLVYWGLGKWLKWQNIFLLLASYTFIAWVNVWYAFLLAVSSFAAWGSGTLMGRLESDKPRRYVNIFNITVNVALLAFFKYFNFFATGFDFVTGQIILPLGISFYTFQAIAYGVDVYKRKIAPATDFVAFFTFMSFFPKVVSGPIERGNTLLPQLTSAQKFDYSRAVDGCRQMLWGFFKKMVIADACATQVDKVWGDFSAFSSASLVIAMVLFSFQVYCDLSGYTDIALGAARLFGIELSRNFNNPYFSRNIPEFWRRWHISLMTWFRDYIYIQLGGSRCKKWRITANTIIVFLVSGLWHGADSTFICYGLYHGLLCSMFVVTGWKSKFKNEVGEGRVLPSMKELGMIVLTFSLVTTGRILFRAENMESAIGFVSRLLSFSGGNIQGLWLIALCGLLLTVEWFQRGKSHPLQIGGKYRFARWALYLTLTLMCIFGHSGDHAFYYYQF